MDKSDIAFVGFLIVVGLFFIGAIIGIYTAFENQNIRQEFCENEGFEGHDMGDKYHIGHCYKTQGENATVKDFFCKPAPNVLTPIGKCKFLEVK